MGDSENPKQDLKDTAPPAFSYSEIIVDPSALGSSPDAKNLTKNMSALTSYTDLLITSDSSANANPGHALGDQYFLKTSATCMLDGKSVPRYIYINHQPVSHNKKFVTTKKDMKFNGLIPGIVDDIFKLNPFKIFGAFAENDTPDCSQATLSTTAEFSPDKYKSGELHEIYETKPITLDDLKNVGPCSWQPDGEGTKVNTITGEVCPYKELVNIGNDIPSRSHFYCSRSGHRNNTGCINGRPDKRRFVPCGYVIKSSEHHSGGPGGKGLQGPCEKMADGSSQAKVPQNNPKEGFKTMASFNDDKIVTMYYTSLAVLSIYILYLFIIKNK